MAKRFTDTDKWKRSWFRQLSPKAKVAWMYLLDQCDHAGIWIADFDLMSFQCGFQVDAASLTEWIGGKLVQVDTDKYAIPSFYDFQYSEAKDGFKAKQSALKSLIKYGILNEDGSKNEQLPNTSEQSKDCPSIGIGISIGISKKGGVGENKTPTEFFDFESLYQKYPRKEGKTGGMKQCRKQIQTRADFDALSIAIDRYAKHCREKNQIVKMFSSFMGSDRTDHPWREWLDPNTGTVSHAPESEPDWKREQREKEARNAAS